MKLSDFKALTFDVYGTLIDWESSMNHPNRLIRRTSVIRTCCLLYTAVWPKSGTFPSVETSVWPMGNQSKTGQPLPIQPRH